MKINQGDIFFADSSPVKGHEQAGYRPVLILQNNILNNNLNTVIVAPITTNLNAKGRFTTFYLSQKLSKLPHDSVVLLFHVRTIDVSRLRKKVATLERSEFLKAKEQLKFVF